MMFPPQMTSQPNGSSSTQGVQPGMVPQSFLDDLVKYLPIAFDIVSQLSTQRNQAGFTSPLSMQGTQASSAAASGQSGVLLQSFWDDLARYLPIAVGIVSQLNAQRVQTGSAAPLNMQGVQSGSAGVTTQSFWDDFVRYIPIAVDIVSRLSTQKAQASSASPAGSTSGTPSFAFR